MKKINIVTRCNYKSIGSMLQAYGLQQKLIELNCKPKTLIYAFEKEFSKKKVNSLRNLCKAVFDVFIMKKLKSAFLKRTAFINDNIYVKYYTNYEELVLEEKVDDCDLYISGSDQVWQPEKCDPLYFLDFAAGKKRASYAASMGKTNIPKEKKKNFELLVNNMDYISVREDECADIINFFTDKEVQVHIDPIFLLSVEKWRKISKPYNLSKPYILLYMLYWDNDYKNKIKELRKKTGLKVYAIANELSRVYADGILYDVGVEEFLWLIDNAEYVVTSSFHGVAFSILFNKKFSANLNPVAPSRIENIMRKLEIPTINIEELPNFDLAIYKKTNKLIQLEVNRSIEYLNDIIL